jgi:predicted CXXCH cytochrome family protein
VARPLRDGHTLTIEMSGDGEVAGQHRLTYFLGHNAIEQHLAEFPGGKLQAVPVGFDTQRHEWFDIFAGDPRQPSDWGHWANRGMTANSQCLYCHTTGYHKGYLPDRDEYQSRWAEAGVGCEACHGPGAPHVSARRAGEVDHYDPVRADRLLDLCASCHALRRERWAGFRPGDRFLDFFEPLLIDGEEYHADGQLRVESYEWGSFLQSEMFRTGVGCTDCHEAHSGNLHAQGNALCLRCHDARLASTHHTHHEPESPGSQCVGCHMPATMYMQRDRRRDHSFPLPDPAATVALGVPNACDSCHRERAPAWAAERVREWFGDGGKREARRRLATAVSQGRRADPASLGLLVDCAASCPNPMWRASAVRLLAGFMDRDEVLDTLFTANGSSEPLVRAQAAWCLSEKVGTAANGVRAALLTASRDEIRLVRLNAAWGLRVLTDSQRSAEDQSVAESARNEWLQSMGLLAEHAETHHTVGVYHADRGATDVAEMWYRSALRLAPDSIPPRHNLAMLLAARGDARGAEEHFLRVRALDPRFAPAACGLGAIYGNDERWEEAAKSLQECLKIDPTYRGALYDLAHAYVELGLGDVANVVLEAALGYPDARPEALRALVTVNLALGDREVARRWAREAAATDRALAGDPRVRELLAE